MTLLVSRVKFRSSRKKDGLLITFVLLVANQYTELEPDFSFKSLRNEDLSFLSPAVCQLTISNHHLLPQNQLVYSFCASSLDCETTLLLVPHPAKCPSITTSFFFFFSPTSHLTDSSKVRKPCPLHSEIFPEFFLQQT